MMHMSYNIKGRYQKMTKTGGWQQWTMFAYKET